MTRNRNLSDLLDTNGDVKSAALDNVPASNNASALTTGTLPDARLSNQAKVVKGTSAPGSPQAGDLWYDTNTGVAMLKVYNSGSAVWIATNVVAPTISSISGIETGVSGNITITGTNFGTGQGVISFTPSGGSASTVNATPTSDTSVSAAVPSAIYNQSAGTSIGITFRNSGGLTSATTNISVSAQTSGGTIVSSGGYKYHTFTSSGNFVLPAVRNIEYIMVAGGGSSGSYGGGGGAGGMLAGTVSNMSANTYAIVIGAGGVHTGTDNNSSSDNGDNTTFNSLTAVGGGRGATGGSNGFDGGSGGGGSYAGSTGGNGTAGQGNNGGSSSFSDPYPSGGGGGKGAVGGNASSNTQAGSGGNGINTYSAWATATSTGDSGYYAGGGGGGTAGGSGYIGGGQGGTGGNGGGGNGGVGGSGMQNGDANTGGGGGSGAYSGSNSTYYPKNGGSGIVILRYAV
nr:hypothetical protein [uncultured Mediterranean phage uvMED]